MSGYSLFEEAEVDAYLAVNRANGTTEYFHVVDGENHPITREQYEEATRWQ